MTPVGHAPGWLQCDTNPGLLHVTRQREPMRLPRSGHDPVTIECHFLSNRHTKLVSLSRRGWPGQTGIGWRTAHRFISGACPHSTWLPGGSSGGLPRGRGLYRAMAAVVGVAAGGGVCPGRGRDGGTGTRGCACSAARSRNSSGPSMVTGTCGNGRREPNWQASTANSDSSGSCAPHSGQGGPRSLTNSASKTHHCDDSARLNRGLPPQGLPAALPDPTGSTRPGAGSPALVNSASSRWPPPSGRLRSGRSRQPRTPAAPTSAERSYSAAPAWVLATGPARP